MDVNLRNVPRCSSIYTHMHIHGNATIMIVFMICNTFPRFPNMHAFHSPLMIMEAHKPEGEKHIPTTHTHIQKKH